MDQVKGLIGNLEKKGEVIQAKIQQKFERKLGSPIRRLLSNKKRLPVAKNGYLSFSNVAWQKQDASTSSAHAFRSMRQVNLSLSLPSTSLKNHFRPVLKLLKYGVLLWLVFKQISRITQKTGQSHTR